MDSAQQDVTQQPISDDQELAKALAGVLPDAQGGVQVPVSVPAQDSAMQFQETPIATSAPQVEAYAEPQPAFVPEAPQPVEQPAFEQPAFVAPTGNGDLEGIKKDALIELRPLIDKVTLPAEEKFDTYLMLIRSTDDSSLIGPAHAIAQSITDETRRAEALLDIIKEIDYLSNSQSHQS